MSDTFFCPRAIENGGGPDSPFHAPMNGEATWRDDATCSYCGSMKPEAFFRAVEAGSTVVPTDKNYKAYVREAGAPRDGKVYFQHFDEADKHRFIELVNSKRMTIGMPGHFYRIPFFCQPAFVGGDPAAQA